MERPKKFEKRIKPWTLWLKGEILTNRSIFHWNYCVRKIMKMLIIAWIQSKDFNFLIIIGHYLIGYNYVETNVTLNSLFLFNVLFLWGFNVVRLFIIFKSKKLNHEKEFLQIFMKKWCSNESKPFKGVPKSCQNVTYF